MANEARKAPVRIRTRIRSKGSDQRLVAEPAADKPRKRKANSGSMKPGETRNPGGRPKGAKGTKAMVRKILSTRTTLREGSATRKVTLYHALLLKEVQLAVDGDWRARRTVLELGRWALPEENPAKVAASSTDETDKAILDWFEGEIRARSASESSDDE